MTRTEQPRRSGRVVPGLALALSLVATACITEQELATAPMSCPSQENFRTVSAVLERRCGTLDCHGVLARPLRIYGQYGLRRPQAPVEGLPFDFDEYYTGGEVATTDAEVADNYLSACGLEPELMAAVLGGEEAPEVLTLVRKPRLEEKHKGGKIWDTTIKGDACLLSWINGAVEPEPCRIELERP